MSLVASALIVTTLLTFFMVCVDGKTMVTHRFALISLLDFPKGLLGFFAVVVFFVVVVVVLLLLLLLFPIGYVIQLTVW